MFDFLTRTFLRGLQLGIKPTSHCRKVVATVVVVLQRQNTEASGKNPSQFKHDFPTKIPIGQPRVCNQTKREGIMTGFYEKPNVSPHARMDQAEWDQFVFCL